MTPCDLERPSDDNKHKKEGAFAVCRHPFQQLQSRCCYAGWRAAGAVAPFSSQFTGSPCFWNSATIFRPSRGADVMRASAGTGEPAASLRWPCTQ